MPVQGVAPAPTVHSMPAPEPLRVVVLRGDGIGPEVVDATLEVLEATGLPWRWELRDVGQRAYAECGEALPAAVVSAVEDCGVALKGPVATPVGAPFRSVNVALRRALDLFLQVRPVRSLAGAPSRFDGVDLQVVRETTEDLYRGIEVQPGTPDAHEALAWLRARGHDLPPSTGLSIKPLSDVAARRALRRACAHAVATGRRRVTVVHKAAVMQATDAVFLREGLALQDEHPDLTIDALAVDAAAAELVRRPEELDVLVTTNLYGDVLSDVAAAVVGGLGLAPGANFGDRVAVFEAAHGTAPRRAGLDLVNPLAMVLSGALMLDHVGLPEQGDRVRAAVADVVRDGTDVTYDLRPTSDGRPSVGTRRAARAVADRLR